MCALHPKQIMNCVIYAENYAIAGAILFYGKEHGLPETICFNDNFTLWAPDRIDPDVLIYVNWNTGGLESFFNEIKLADQINNEYFRDNGLKVYLCTDPQDDFPGFYTGKVAALKSKYWK